MLVIDARCLCAPTFLRTFLRFHFLNSLFNVLSVFIDHPISVISVSAFLFFIALQSACATRRFAIILQRRFLHGLDREIMSSALWVGTVTGEFTISVLSRFRWIFISFPLHIVVLNTTTLSLFFIPRFISESC